MVKKEIEEVVKKIILKKCPFAYPYKCPETFNYPEGVRCCCLISLWVEMKDKNLQCDVISVIRGVNIKHARFPEAYPYQDMKILTCEEVLTARF